MQSLMAMAVVHPKAHGRFDLELEIERAGGSGAGRSRSLLTMRPLFLLDTNICIDLMSNQAPQVAQRLEGLEPWQLDPEA